MMKKLLVMMVLAIAGIAVVQAKPAAENPAAGKHTAGKAKISLADARGKIDKAIESPEVMKEIMKGLSAEDQVKFLADVNKAIGDMPASIEEKTAKFLIANRVALTTAQKGNTTALLAETFATVSPDALTEISERFAVELLNRASNPNITYTDDQFAKLATEVMEKINERTEKTDNGSARSAFAIIMFMRASNETGDALEKLQDQMIDTLKHDDAKELAKEEWIPSALGKDGRTQGYEPLLASADAGRRPDSEQVLVITGPQHLDSVLGDLVGKNTDAMNFSATHTPILDAIENKLIKQNPTLGANIGQAGETGTTEGGGAELGPNGENPRPNEWEPEPYPGQH